MTLELLDAPTPAPTRAKRPRAAKPSIGADASKDKVTLCLSAAANLRLTIHAAALGMDRSALVEKLIGEHLRRFVLQDRGDRESTQEVSAA
jgi:hypothetical protein